MTMYIDELGEERTEFRRLAHIEDGEIVAAVDDRFEEMLTDEMLTSYEALQERLDGTQYFALHYDESDIEEKEEKYTYPRTPADDAKPEVNAAVKRYREEVDEEEKEERAPVEKPGPDATNAEIMAWMEDSYSGAIAEGIANTLKNDDSDDE
jgi:hypothetical protein